MALVGDVAQITRIAGSLRELGTPSSRPQELIAIGVGVELKERLRTEFTASQNPSGNPWKLKKSGKPALVSNKIPGSFEFYPTATGVGAKSKIEWLEAHQTGHVFPARQAAARTAAKEALGNRFVSFKKVLQAAKGKNVERVETTRGTMFIRQRKTRSDILVRAVEVKAHEVRSRTLPARPFLPVSSTMPAPWAESINKGAALGWEAWRVESGIE